MAYRTVEYDNRTTDDNISVSQSSQSNVEDASVRKSFHSVEIRDVPSAEKTRLDGKTMLKSSNFSKSGSWTFEIVSVLFAVASVAAIIGVLARFDGKPLPSWPYDITLNAMIALLATIANASMAVPLSSGLSQLKWIRFKTGRAPLADMEIFDEASRGTLGALKMLVKLRGGFTGSFGALVAIVAITLGPFSQQIATYRARITSSPIGATNFRALNYTAALPGNTALEGFVPILPMKAATYNGLFAENGKPWTSLPTNCQTGNCTWEPFETLAVCNQCVDMTEYMSRYCANGTPEDGNMTSCGWSLPSGAVLNSSSEVFSMTSLFPSAYSQMPYSTIMKLIFMGTESQSGLAGALEPWATQCTLSACVQTISSSITNGELSENITHTVTNDTVPVGGSVASLDPVLIGSAHGNGTYLISMEAMLGMRSWFGELFANGSAARNDRFINQTIDTGDAVLVNLTVGISSGTTFFDSDIVQAFYWNYYEYPGGIDMLMRDLAVSVTVSFRSFLGAVEVLGLALSIESFVHVRWGFVAAPVLAVLLTAAFLGVAMYRSWRCGARLWKSSALAMLLHGLDGDARGRFEATEVLEVQKREAKGVKVQLDDGAVGGASLLRISRLPAPVTCTLQRELRQAAATTGYSGSTSVPEYFQTTPELYAGPTATGEAPFLAETNAAPFSHVSYIAPQPLETQQPIMGNTDNRNIFQQMGHLSPYFANPDGFGVNEYPLPAGANITQLHMLHRHGSRYPTSSDGSITLSQKIVNASGTFNATGDLAFLNGWTNKLGAEILVPVGKQQSTTQDRMTQSAEYFLAGFFGLQWTGNVTLELIIEQQNFNNSLAGYYQCNNSNAAVNKGGSNATTEWIGIYLVNATERIKPQVEGLNWTISDTYYAQSLCAYETVALGFSHFCSLFTYEEWLGFEYSIDLSFAGGYGFQSPTGRAVGIGYVQEVLARLNHHVIDTPTAQVNVTLDNNTSTFPLDQALNFDFSHDTNIMAILTAFGLKQFAPFFPATEYTANRSLIVSHMEPFAARLDIEVIEAPYPVLASRSGSSAYNTTGGPTKYVHFVLNQRTVPLHRSFPECEVRDDGWCDLETFMKVQQTKLAEAEYDWSCWGSYPAVPYGTITDGVPVAEPTGMFAVEEL
ncbi:putative acid phosphatase protein [Neofusicoccum parvum]|uniref:Acid phosphatase protein n=1 Tax=Neofusicoccum parvum TaxID=310453 RepID=A0ACB5SMB8_9PEZI|nr:putative acid phosphatase protein [Neofusicoccum parvum]